MNTIEFKEEFEEKPIEFFGKDDEKFVNDKIRELREKRNNLQDRIYELSKQLTLLEKERENTQKEIDQEFLKQEHAYDLVGKYVLYKDSIYHVNEIERIFTGVRIKSNICARLYINGELWINPFRKTEVSIPFDDLDILLNENTESCRILSFKEFKDTVRELINKTMWNK